ncbi:hypothetical protein GWI33_011919 [Rhynchophorus ferrugineus]|uniref:Uncharacterized protein n=1 Tax=Rhynchophorus ferrugineus TaxID=354439 RepID=A0A834IW91_RHYFE|nr:hypothetical protein GWI33_011919 [Rhynchophorus ferrugineus]
MKSHKAYRSPKPMDPAARRPNPSPRLVLREENILTVDQRETRRTSSLRNRSVFAFRNMYTYNGRRIVVGVKKGDVCDNDDHHTSSVHASHGRCNRLSRQIMNSQPVAFNKASGC